MERETLPNTTKVKIKSKLSPDNINARWWLINDEDIYTHLFAAAAAIDNMQGIRRALNVKYLQLYSNMESIGYLSSFYNRALYDNYFNARISLNVCKAAVDTITSKVGKNDPRVTFLTTNGDWSKQQRAKKLTKFIDGLFDEAKVYELGIQSFRDSCILDIGVLKFYICNGKIKCEKIMPFEIKVDYAEGLYGNPKTLYQTKFIDRETLLDMFPDKAKIINTAGSATIQDGLTYSDRVGVVEAWHLRSGENAKDGKHVICVDTGNLVSEQYTKEYFPFVFMKWTDRTVGFYGQSLVEEIYPIQMEINKMCRTIQIGQHLSCVPRVFVENSSKVISAHIDNNVGGIVKYSGTKPEFSTSMAFPPEMYQHLDYLYRKAFEITGISLLSATSQKPAGLNAGVALREYQDIESERFSTLQKKYEKFYINAANICIDLMKDIYETDKSVSVKASNKRFIDTIKWKDVNMEEDEYVIRAFPTSMLPTTPAGRLQQIQELIQAGFIGKEDALSLLDFPDLDNYTSMYTSSKEIINQYIELMLEDNQYNPPEPYFNLQLAETMIQNAYLRAKTQSVPEERLELLRRFYEDIKELQNMAQQQLMAQQQAMAPQPTALPQLPQRTELLPNVPQQPI